MLIRDLVCAAVAPHYEDFQFYAATTANKYLPRWHDPRVTRRRSCHPLLPLSSSTSSLFADRLANAINTCAVHPFSFFFSSDSDGLMIASLSLLREFYLYVVLCFSLIYCYSFKETQRSFYENI